MATIWPDVKKEFFDVIKGFKRIPNHGEAKLQNDIDVRTIYDKLKTFDPEIIETFIVDNDLSLIGALKNEKIISIKLISPLENRSPLIDIKDITKIG